MNKEVVIEHGDWPEYNDSAAVGASNSTELLPCGFHPMATAPKDGTEIDILFQHRNYYYADENKRDEWQQVCKAYWTDFNTGGWVWHGIAGVPICWRPAR